MKILIVDDDPMVSQINEKFAMKVDSTYQVKIALSLSKAKEYLLSSSYDLVLLDIYFPKGRGTELLKWIRDNNIKTDVILITADKTIATIEIGLNLGITDYIIKPFTFERFRDAVTRVQKKLKLFSSGDTTDQENFDTIVMEKSIIPPPEDIECEKVLEKGLSCHTFNSIWKIIDKEPDLFTAETLGDKAGLARVTVRRYVEYMLKERYLEMELSYGKVGRPQHYYRKKK